MSFSLKDYNQQRIIGRETHLHAILISVPEEMDEDSKTRMRIIKLL